MIKFELPATISSTGSQNETTNAMSPGPTVRFVSDPSADKIAVQYGRRCSTSSSSNNNIENGASSDDNHHNNIMNNNNNSKPTAKRGRVTNGVGVAETAQQVRRGRGRPRIVRSPEVERAQNGSAKRGRKRKEEAEQSQPRVVKSKGRPRKYPLPASTVPSAAASGDVKKRGPGRPSNQQKDATNNNNNISSATRPQITNGNSSAAVVAAARPPAKSAKVNGNAANVQAQMMLAKLAKKDPFTLVDTQCFDDDTGPPFFVKIKLDALATMDLHAHCLTTEVIGLLGGFYCRVTRTLHIRVVEPCFSIDDHETQCEMDPVSQAIAQEKIEALDMQVVGWYHSHPTFSPTPSQRDIETQSYYQNMFDPKENGHSESDSLSAASSTSGGEASECGDLEEGVVRRRPIVIRGRPYVGFIVSPYMKTELQSQQLGPKAFTLYEPIEPENKNARFFANNICYNYCSVKEYRYFTHEINSLLSSNIKCFWVGDSQYSKSFVGIRQNFSIPYELDLCPSRDETFIPSITKKLSEMCQWIIRDYAKSSIAPQKRYNRIGSIEVNYLEKIIASLSYHLQNETVLHLCTETECERIRRECASILIEELVNKPQRPLDPSMSLKRRTNSIYKR